MSRQANPTVIGAFVVGAIALVVAGVLSFASGVFTRDRFEAVAYFLGNVRGLQQGSAVEFRGVRVGTVTDISLVYDAEQRAMRIPVRMELDPGRLRVIDADSGARSRDSARFLDELVDQGLRAQLDLQSFVTGQLSVGLDLRPETPAQRVGGTEVYELPTAPSALDRFAQVLQELPLAELVAKLISTLDATERLVTSGELDAAVHNAARAAGDASRLVTALESRIGPLTDSAQAALEQARATLAGVDARAQRTLADYADLAQAASSRMDTLATRLDSTLDALATLPARIESRLGPMIEPGTAAMEEARGALANARALLAERSRTRYNLDVALEELAGAARSLRVMAEYLEQHPEALLRGKGP